MEHYDVAIIGAGPGGYECALACAGKHLNTALIEENLVGGTCLNRGCISMSVLMEAAKEYAAMKSPVQGLTADSISLDLSKLQAYKNGAIYQQRKSAIRQLKRAGVTLIEGRGKLAGAGVIEIERNPQAGGGNSTEAGSTWEEKQLLHADSIVLATGSSPIRLNPDMMTSDELLELQEIPEELTILGGGIIGLECACLFAMLGTRVTVLEQQDTVLPMLDPEVRSSLLNALGELENLEIRTGVTTQEYAAQKDCSEAANGTCTGMKEPASDHRKMVLCAVGRRPNTDALGPEKIGVKTENGFISVNDRLETNVPGIYAIGDVTGHEMLAPVATAAGRQVAEEISGKSPMGKMSMTPHCLHTIPQAAWVGLSEEEARKQFAHVKTGSASAAGNVSCILNGCANGLAKLIVNGDTGEILGAQVVAPHASELIAEIAVLMNCGGTVTQLRQTLHPHPSESELWIQAADTLS